MSDVDGYVAWDPPRLCDTCGDLYRMSQMRKLPGGTFSCTERCAGERSATELSRANARQKPFQYRPVKNAKPEDPNNPDTFEADDGAILNFVARMVTAGTRYESVTSGQPAPLSGHMLEGLPWAALYLYGIIADNTRSTKTISRAKTLLSSIASQLIARQQGFGVFPAAAQATDPFWGGFVESTEPSIDSKWYSENAAVAGLALLRAYQVAGTTSYIASARAAASFLRNVQAIGSHGAHYTSSDSAGTGRLYTGGVLQTTIRRIDVDAGFAMWADHMFYPAGLLALQFWKALKDVDGDQSIGATAAITSSFTAAPSQLLSASITDIRACWANGIADSTGTVVNGLSVATPREFFNAYPASKAPFAAGSGRWEYQDGDANGGTLVSSLNFAKALSALYAYEGVSAQVAAVDDWMRSFTSNASFESPTNQSDELLQRATTGTYDPTACPATLLLVAATQNGSSAYDWGAFGLLSPLWAARHTGTFPDARRSACGIRWRYHDGLRSDGDYKDLVSLRGKSGLSYQTAFVSYTTSFGSFDGDVTSPDTTALAYRFQANAGLTVSGTAVDWVDQTGNGWDVHSAAAAGIVLPTLVQREFGDQPGLFFGNAGAFGSTWSLRHYGGPFYTGPAGSFSSDTPWPFTESQPHVVYAVVKPHGTPPGGGTAGGMIVADRDYFARQLWTLSGVQQRVARNAANFLYVNPSVDYSNTPLLVVYRWTGSQMFITVNGTALRTISDPSGLVSADLAPVTDAADRHTLRIGGSIQDESGFAGSIAAVYLDLSTTVKAQTVNYLSKVYGSAVASMTNDVARAAMFGQSLRQAPRSTPVQAH